ncbi:MAG: hypothetical protein HOH74_28270, partial [Gemmatimonadetes bacterium]|nr:hypothetical protein [Gemmatimonadota bacterium]
MQSRFLYVGSAQNDLVQVATDCGISMLRCVDLAQAIDTAPGGGAVLCLADDYPVPGAIVSEALLQQAVTKGVRLYLEYPAELPGIQLGEPQPTQWERAVVASDFFAPDLTASRILALHGCWYLPLDGVDSTPHM